MNFAKLKSIILYLNWLVFFCFFLLIFIEVSLRIFKGGYIDTPLHNFNHGSGTAFDYDPIMAWRMKKYFPIFARFRQDPELSKQELNQEKEGKFIYSTSDGFIPNRKEGLTKNIEWDAVSRHLFFLLGGSTAMGEGVSDYTKTIPAQLEHLLRKKNPSICIINAGVGGYQLAQEKLYAFNELIYRKPTGFIFYDGWNNVNHAESKMTIQQMAWSRYHWRLNNAIKIQWNKDEISLIKKLYFDFKNLFFDIFPHISKKLLPKIKNTTLGYFKSRPKISDVDLKYYIPNSFNPSGDNNDELTKNQLYLKNTFFNFKNDLLQCAAICSEMDLKCIFILQPLIWAGNKPLTYVEKEKIFNFLIKTPRAQNIMAIYKYLEQLYIDLDKRFKDNKKIKFIVLTSVFDEEKRRVYIDSGHLNDLGSRIVAKEIAKYFNNYFKLVE